MKLQTFNILDVLDNITLVQDSELKNYEHITMTVYFLEKYIRTCTAGHCLRIVVARPL